MSVFAEGIAGMETRLKAANTELDTIAYYLEQAQQKLVNSEESVRTVQEEHDQKEKEIASIQASIQALHALDNPQPEPGTDNPANVPLIPLVPAEPTQPEPDDEDQE